MEELGGDDASHDQDEGGAKVAEKGALECQVISVCALLQ